MNKRQVKESSGLELTADETTFWTHADSGNPPQLYQINAAGKLLNAVDIMRAANLDWEDLTKDDAGYLYIWAASHILPAVDLSFRNHLIYPGI